MDEISQLDIVGRHRGLFSADLKAHKPELDEKVSKGRFLVVGGAGSIGSAVVREIFLRNPKSLHVVDISENNLVELVRFLRSSKGYIDGDFETYALDSSSAEFDALFTNNEYDYVLNLSALKHVRSESDAYTLMRLLNINIFNALRLYRSICKQSSAKYFCVSTDKAANPANLMGASKRIMEMFLSYEASKQQANSYSMARFANVAFSDGSLLYGFNQRLKNNQPITAPSDVKRYFVTAQESGLLCLMSTLFGNAEEIFFPKLDENEHLITFEEITRRYLKFLGKSVYECSSELEAREEAGAIIKSGAWPCFFFRSDTTGEKPFEEFYVQGEMVELERFSDLGIVKSSFNVDGSILEGFERSVSEMRNSNRWSKQELVAEIRLALPTLKYEDVGKYLNGKM